MQEFQGLDIEIAGWACRLPGSSSVENLWALLRDERCAVTEIPSDRWSRECFSHPRGGERGKSYTFAAGVLDDIWGFDAEAFGLSPREAEQMDPQQRLLLELTWEALEDAGLPPSSLIGTDTGVFVGASTVDHGNAMMFDIAVADPYFATGNAASVLANRISHVFDLAGPSMVLDTACSSSLVALDTACQALRNGRCETAIVAGVNLIMTPIHFVAFSQASMLSRRGLCQPFSANADGYVRAEGGVVLILRSASALQSHPAHARILATRVNSDGRTNGIALPSQSRQAKLLAGVYGSSGFDPNDLAFVEAHGTGTPVGDPVEAQALGEVLGRRRNTPLPIGSIKSNIGHTEAAAGLAGVLKATLALKHDLLPASLHCGQPNPRIDFSALGLKVAQGAVPLSRTEAPRLAGVSAYGFGGTNAHVVLADAKALPTAQGSPPSVLLLSAHTRSALADLVHAYGARIAQGDKAAAGLIAAANVRREHLPERLVLPLKQGEEPGRILQAFAADPVASGAAMIGTAVARRAPVAFVFSGNGSQWVGMGRRAMHESAAFRVALAEIDAHFVPLSGWSLLSMLQREDLAAELSRTSVAQPLIFGLQSASARVLKKAGLIPAVVLGHSVGEVAAAEAAGLIDLPTAVKIIYFRSLHQERVAGQGGMAVLIGAPEVAHDCVAQDEELAIAAWNSPRALTVSGSYPALERLAAAVRSQRIRLHRLDLPYPFHSSLVDPIESALLKDLDSIQTFPGHMQFVSTVTGDLHASEPLDSTYWWRNIREPVLFSRAIHKAYGLGARIFVEIGPSPILLSHIKDNLADESSPVAILAVLDTSERSGDPFTRAVAAALAYGAEVEAEVVLGRDTGRALDLPAYPWQRKRYRLAQTEENTGLLTSLAWHPLIGSRARPDASEWRVLLDTTIVPSLADHVVAGHVILPGAAFTEIAVAVAREWFGSNHVRVAQFHILQPLVLDPPTIRELRCRVETTTGLLDIMSRPRLVPNGWQLHATGKISDMVDAARQSPEWPTMAEPPDMIGEELYRAAAEAGLSYGPSYRLLAEVRRIGPNRIAAELLPTPSDPRFNIDPARMDACFHALVMLFGELASDQATKPYVPVSFSACDMLQPGIPFKRALFEIKRRDSRSIIADLVLADAAGETVLRFEALRFQSLSSPRKIGQEIELFVGYDKLASEPLAAVDEPDLSADVVRAAVQDVIDSHCGRWVPSADYVLMEGWATSLAFSLASALASERIVDLQGRAVSGAMPKPQILWCERLLELLLQAGLARQLSPGRYELQPNPGLPDPGEVLATLAAECPNRSAELLLAASLSPVVRALTRGEPVTAAGGSPSAIEAFESGGQLAQASSALLCSVLDRLAESCPQDRALRILQVGDSPMSALLADYASRGVAELTIVEADSRRLEQARLSLGNRTCIGFVASLAQLPKMSFDLLLANHSLQRVALEPAGWTGLADALAPNAVLLAIEASPSLFRELVFGGPFSHMNAGRFRAGLSPTGWRNRFAELGLQNVSVLPLAGLDGSIVCVGQAVHERVALHHQGAALVVGQGELAAAFATMLRFSGLNAELVGEAEIDLASDGFDRVVVLPDDLAALSSSDRITARCLALADTARGIGARDMRLVVVCRGATDNLLSDPVEAAVWAFARCLANEYPMLDVRLVDLARGMPAAVAARRLKDIVFSDTAETEIFVESRATRVKRYRRLGSLGSNGPLREPASVLVKGDGTGLDRVGWRGVERVSPTEGEVEIEVEAAGLNFRDVMWALSILPDEILEDGYAGPTLGLECAGHVVRVGAGVEGLKPGDPVIAFARSALATHVTVPATYVALRPAELSAEAAATIPVAFLTAYYALIECTRLAEGEWVLVHGGAGGVGMAALQIARWRGARVIATAGAQDRKDLLTVLGAEHVFDSRSVAFASEVLRVTGTGVHVVLNSLSGEAMERSIGVLRPFGRFVELGKRDYVANTHLGLRPFRRNLSYFGVDLDQLMISDQRAARRLFEGVVRLFEEGMVSPLPYRVFAASDAVEAFRVMQRSGHIGKIVIRPPQVSSLPARVPFTLAVDRTHLVTGGLSGFGLATARWLVDHGARHLALVGRTGASRPEAQRAIDVMRAAGVDLRVGCVDITDEDGVAAFLADIEKSMPPLAGIVHAAAVYADSIVANLTSEKLQQVLRSKVIGADVFDHLTREMPLDYFVLYSSATTMIGNPGQAAYVAANAYLEGLASRRRRQGLPALAIAWGAIADAGILTRSSAAASNLLTRSGVHGMPARDALERLWDILSWVGTRTDVSTVAIAAVKWSAAQVHLRGLRSPTFSGLTEGPAREADALEKISIRDLVKEYGAEDASRKVEDAVRDEIARILRMARDDVSSTRPLMEIGLDSLMGVELAMALEQRFVMEAQLSQSAGTMTVREVAKYLVGLESRAQFNRDDASERVAMRHLDPDLREAAIDAKNKIEGRLRPIPSEAAI